MRSGVSMFAGEKYLDRRREKDYHVMMNCERKKGAFPGILYRRRVVNRKSLHNLNTAPGRLNTLFICHRV